MENTNNNNLRKVYYSCDRGSLNIKFNDTEILFDNGIGDGEYSVTILRNGTEEYKEEMRKLGESQFDIVQVTNILTSDYKSVDIMDYDCSNAEILFDLKQYDFVSIYRVGEYKKQGYFDSIGDFILIVE